MGAVAISRLDRRLAMLYAALGGRACCLAHSTTAAAAPPAPPAAATPTTLTAFGAHLTPRWWGECAGSFGALGFAATACALGSAFSATLRPPRGLAAALTALPVAALPVAAFATIPATLATITPTSVATLAACAIGVTTMPGVFPPTVSAAAVIAPRAAG